MNRQWRTVHFRCTWRSLGFFHAHDFNSRLVCMINMYNNHLRSRRFMDPIEWVALIVSTLAAIGTIVTVVISAYKYFGKKNAEKIRSIQNLYCELNDTLKGLDILKYPHNVLSMKIDVSAGNEKIAYFMNRSLNHDFYDSLISSGAIYLLDQDIQQTIQHIFRLIKTHNNYLEIAMRMLRQPQPVMEEIWPYVYWLEQNQPRITMIIREVMDKLEERFMIDECLPSAV
ncbi:hypothetical protein CENSYa_0318 [Cenarchaeum symbiosum A]|uniref:Uncharacterized protein n=1 Tax=Cenarchaeum symbiosum (strain A) TaxID=414004 RepID=A0RUD7_CENSY|nr:hypothetical protein CENSYa_0318 [Cenarchaeum symbiosum A]